MVLGDLGYYNLLGGGERERSRRDGEGEGERGRVRSQGERREERVEKRSGSERSDVKEYGRGVERRGWSVG